MTPEPVIAWMLAEAAASCLAGYQRTMVFVEIGSGESLLAIERILTAVVQARFVLPAATVAKLGRWLDCYIDGPEEHRLRRLVAGIQSEPPAECTAESAVVSGASSATRWVQIVDVNPRAIVRHSPSITCPVPQVAASIRDWFPNAGVVVHDTIDALQHTLCAGGCADQPAALLNLVVEPVAD